MDSTMVKENKPCPPIGNTSATNNKPITTYHEKKIGNNLYRITNVYLGKIELAKALEDLTVRKILQDENAALSATL